MAKVDKETVRKALQELGSATDTATNFWDGLRQSTGFYFCGVWVEKESAGFAALAAVLGGGVDARVAKAEEAFQKACQPVADPATTPPASVSPPLPF